MTNWVWVPREDALGHPLYGVRGWLLLFVVGQFLGVGATHNEAVQLAAQAGYADSFQWLHSPGGGLPAFYRLMYYTELVWALVVIWMAYTKNASFVRICFIVMLLRWPWILAVAIYSGVFWQEWLAGLILSLLHVAIWGTYLLRSRRVKVTFEQRVRHDDPYLEGITTSSGGERIAVEDSSGKPSERLSNDAFATAWQECEVGTVDKGLWARSFSECRGDPAATKAKYLELRVADLIQQDELR